MKVGLSFSRCVLDIVEGRVDPKDVLVVISRTDFDPTDDEQWAGIWRGYSKGSIFGNAEWASYSDEDEGTFRAVTISLHSDGKLHQPRQFGAYPRRMPYYWLETILPNEELNKNPAAKKAWENFQTVAGLTGVDLDRNYG